MRRDTDIFIVGGGPAGLAAAIAARLRGFRVAVADGGEPPIDKACGEGLLPDGLAVLASLGVHLSESDGHVLLGIRFLDSSGAVEARLPSVAGLGIRRTVLHQKMVDRARSIGVEFFWNSCVTGIVRDGVHLNGEKCRARWIIGADGSGSRVRKWAGLEDSVVRVQRFAFRRHFRVAPWTGLTEVYWGPRMQAYVTPVGADEVGVAVIVGEPGQRLASALHAFPALAERLRSAAPASSERGAVTAMHRLARVCVENVALVGDASGRVDAITGEGLSLGFRHAQALIRSIAAGSLASYPRAHRRLARRPALMGRLLLLLDRSPRLRGRVLRVLSRKPSVFGNLLAAHVGHATVAQVAATGAELGWQLLFA